MADETQPSQSVEMDIVADKVADMVVHCCTLSLCHLGSEIDDHHRNPNINTEII